MMARFACEAGGSIEADHVQSRKSAALQPVAFDGLCLSLHTLHMYVYSYMSLRMSIKPNPRGYDHFQNIK